jgi:hypothetical protein
LGKLVLTPLGGQDQDDYVEVLALGRETDR